MKFAIIVPAIVAGELKVVVAVVVVGGGVVVVVVVGQHGEHP